MNSYWWNGETWVWCLEHDPHMWTHLGRIDGHIWGKGDERIRLYYRDQDREQAIESLPPGWSLRGL